MPALHVTDHLLVEAEGPLGRLTLDRPEKLNPLSTSVLLGIESAARWFDERPEVRVVVVSGTGRAFSAGADLAAFAGPPADGVAVRDAVDAGRRMADALEAMRAVTVARIQGHCIGGGVVLAAACDLRVAGASAVFAIPEVDLGIPLSWGGVPRLVREIGAPATRDLVMTCRRVGASEARELGLVQRVVDDDGLDDAVETLAAQLAPRAPAALLPTKRHVDAITAQMVGLGRSWDEADGFLTALHDEDSRAAAARYLEGLARR
jgi:enoyl-CoA hydratase/carnithine racemase